MVPMVLAVDVKMHDARPFDYVSLMVDQINHGLEKIKANPNESNFRHYFVLVYMLLYVGKGMDMWTNNFRVNEYDRQGMRNLVQMWMVVWDQRCSWSQYLCFQEYFVKPLCQLLGRSCNYALTSKVQKFLRPKEYDEWKLVNHNQGDWYTLKDYTKINVYRFEGASLLPLKNGAKHNCLLRLS